MSATPDSLPRIDIRRPSGTRFRAIAAVVAAVLGAAEARAADAPKSTIDFNRDVRPILSNYCYQCHGPDAAKRKGVSKPLRLDTEKGAFADQGGYAVIVKGNPDESELVQRLISDDPTEVMPPRETGKKLSAREVGVLTEWVRQGAAYAKHWSYVRPVRPDVPAVRDGSWPRNPIDYFVLSRLEKERLKPTPEADRYALIRRVSLDLTGLPPTLEEVDAFVRDTSPDAFASLVDRTLDKPSYGEHWARMWLDLARYADSAGYADDPPRTIWAFRDYVIRSLNANKPFDRFTIEQLAGDLLPSPNDEQLIATAFHRNTLTNNEGGTNDEEFRNVAIVDRVNTTMAVWMGTTMACAQCHDHKYDPLTQDEYFRLFAFFNNTEDADLKDESPLLKVYSDAQKQRKAALEREAESIKETLRTPTPELAAGQERWEKDFPTELEWQHPEPTDLASREGVKMTRLEDRSVLADVGSKNDIYTLKLAPDIRRLSALRLEALTDDGLPQKGPGHAAGKFLVTRVRASVSAPGEKSPTYRYVRIEIPGKEKILSLAEVQVYRGLVNIATGGEARQSSTDYDGPARLAIDGNTDGRYEEAKSTTHTAISDDPWWEVDLKVAGPIERVAIYNRTDGNVESRLSNFRVKLLDADHKELWTQTVAAAPRPKVELDAGAREVAFVAAYTDDPDTAAGAAVILGNKNNAQGWGLGGKVGRARALTLVPKEALALEPGSSLTVRIEQLSQLGKHTLGRFRVAVSDDDRAAELARTPAAILAILKTEPGRRTDKDREELARHYRAVEAPELKAPRTRLAAIEKEMAAIKPETTVPIQRDLAAGQRRKTNLQRRGNFLDFGGEVSEGVPAAFHPLPKDAPRNRLTLARWLVDEQNPLTARVIANRCWEQIFGAGLVPTSEEFGIQGELPTHPELLDWLATELVRGGWDLKNFLKLLVTSAAYRQDSRVSADLVARDPDNQLLARGPRFRLSAEMIRDQALAVSGLLSPRMYGPPVKPPQPSTGLTAAFGGGIDWQTSEGADRYRRGLYTTWRRSNPYPSMTTFDAPNREVCTLRRMRTNTPLQALVTLNDPVYVEAAQALARRIAAGSGTVADKARLGFRLCLARNPNDREVERLVQLYEAARAPLAGDPGRAKELATNPLGPAPSGPEAADLAAWTVVGNVLLNLDEMLMKR